MASISIDWIFNRIYDFLLWIKYFWVFSIMHTKPEDYLAAISHRDWDGLRDRGWFDEYFAEKAAAVPPADVHMSAWQRLAEMFGYRLQDTDADGIPDISDPAVNDSANLSAAQLKERFQPDYTFSDRVRDIFGLPPKDSDADGVPDSYEIAHNMDPLNPDSDRDGLFDGKELSLGSDPLNNDTDRDLVMDGRDEAPLDQRLSVTTTDADGDGVSDIVEIRLGTDSNNKDTDADGIPDGMDTYPLDSNNITPLANLDFSNQTQGIVFHIQSPVLSAVADLLSVMALIGLGFGILFLLWFIYQYWSALNHYEHHFTDGHGHDHGHGAHASHDSHNAHNNHTAHDEHSPLGIPGLATREDAAPHVPANEEFEVHPRWAIIEGYMSSPTDSLWRIGILEADAMLAEVLQEKGYQGTDVGEMLSAASFKTVQLAWDAHKIRNRIAHDGSSFVLTEREAKRTYALYEAVFKELKAI